MAKDFKIILGTMLEKNIQRSIQRDLNRLKHLSVKLEEIGLKETSMEALERAMEEKKLGLALQLGDTSSMEAQAEEIGNYLGLIMSETLNQTIAIRELNPSDFISSKAAEPVISQNAAGRVLPPDQISDSNALLEISNASETLNLNLDQVLKTGVEVMGKLFTAEDTAPIIKSCSDLINAFDLMKQGISSSNLPQMAETFSSINKNFAWSCNKDFLKIA